MKTKFKKGERILIIDGKYRGQKGTIMQTWSDGGAVRRDNALEGKLCPVMFKNMENEDGDI